MVNLHKLLPCVEMKKLLKKLLAIALLLVAGIAYYVFVNLPSRGAEIRRRILPPSIHRYRRLPPSHSLT